MIKTETVTAYFSTKYYEDIVDLGVEKIKSFIKRRNVIPLKNAKKLFEINKIEILYEYGNLIGANYIFTFDEQDELKKEIQERKDSLKNTEKTKQDIHIHIDAPFIKELNISSDCLSSSKIAEIKYQLSDAIKQVINTAINK